MKENFLKIVFVIDESGSMSGSESDVIGGFNNFVEAQKQDNEGEISVSLFKFNSVVHKVIDNQPAANIPPLTHKDYRPSNFTALFDAIGRAINDTDTEIATLAEEERPGKVMFVVITDGHENASRDFSGVSIKSLISSHENLMGWKFIYLGTEIENFDDADSIGTRHRVNTSKGNYMRTMEYMADTASRIKKGSKLDVNQYIDDLLYSLEEMENEKKKK